MTTVPTALSSTAPSPHAPRLSPWLVGGAFAALAGSSLLWWVVIPALPESIRAGLADLDTHKLPWVLLNPAGYVALFLAFLLEWWIPAEPRSSPLTRGTALDLAWCVTSWFAKVLFITGYVTLVRGLYVRHLSFLAIDGASTWPVATRFLAGALMADAVSYSCHVARHKVPLLWRFHAVHHSQTELNFFTDYRIHPVDRLVTHTFQFIPFFVFGAPVSLTALYPLLSSSFTRFYHANIRSNLGWFRFVFVTPQSHRVHHSLDPRHRDQNFGVIFSLWDRLFGTQHPDPHSYPATGVDDASFPSEDGRDWRALPATVIAQLVYPFRPPP